MCDYDCETRECYTISLDSVYAAEPNSNSSFVSYIDVPLRNVVKAELLSASIGISTTPIAVYIHIEELISNFNTYSPLRYNISVGGNTSNVGAVSQLQSNIASLAQSFVTFHTSGNAGRQFFNKQSNYEATTTYINPIRKIDKLTVQIYDETGEIAATDSPTLLVIRFWCAKNNKCLY